jgi:hypothetical protein
MKLSKTLEIFPNDSRDKRCVISTVAVQSYRTAEWIAATALSCNEPIHPAVSVKTLVFRFCCCCFPTRLLL